MPCATRASRKILCGDSCRKSGICARQFERFLAGKFADERLRSIAEARWWSDIRSESRHSKGRAPPEGFSSTTQVTRFRRPCPAGDR